MKALEVITVLLALGLVVSFVTLQFQAALGCGILIVVCGLLSVPGDKQPPRKWVTRPAYNVPAEDPSLAQRQTGSRDIRVLVPEEVLAPGSRPLRIVAAASRQYGVLPEVLLTHWYLESGMSLGGGMGVGRHLALAQIVRQQFGSATAYRRSRFVINEADLHTIAAHCGYDPQEVKGSSTGALGPMQFQPSTWVLGAVDADGDGRACPLNLADAMFTAARKLRRDYERTGSWNEAMYKYAGAGPDARAYVARAQPILRFFRQFWQERMGGKPVASNP